MSYVIGFITNTPSRSYRKRQVASVTLHVVHHVVDGYEPFATHTTMWILLCTAKWDKWKSTFHSQGRHADCCPCTASDGSTVNPCCHVKCSRCDQSYSKNNLLNHVETKHDEAKGMCNFCNQSLIKPHTLQSHMQTAHEINWSRLRSAP